MNKQSRPMRIPKALFSIFAIATLILTSCGGGGGSGDSSASGGAKEGGTLRIAVESDLRFNDATSARDTVSRMILGSTVYDPLFATDEEANPAPALVDVATPSPDFKEWNFKLREGVKFHNGKEFTSEDVVKNINAVLDPKNASELAVDLGNQESVEAVDKYNVKFTLLEPDTELPTLFTDGFYMQDLDNVDPDHPIGTGPYKWKHRTPGDNITFERFDDYWRGKPPLGEVEFRVIPDAQVAVLELQQGGVDIIPNYVSIEAIPSLRENPDIQLASVPGSTYYHAYLNFEKDRRGGYKDGHAIREGLAYLWNAEALVPPIIGDFGTVATQPLPPWQLGNDPNIKPWPYDPEKGKALLAQGGIPEGGTINVLVHNRPYNCNHATAWQSQLVSLGYDVKLQCLEPEAALPEAQKWEWDVLFFRNSGRPAAAASYNARWHSRLAKDLDEVRTFMDPQVDELLAQMLATPDRGEYEKLGQEIARILVQQQIATLPAYWDTVWFASRNNVKGLEAVSPMAYYGFLMNAISTVYLDPPTS